MPSSARQEAAPERSLARDVTPLFGAARLPVLGGASWGSGGTPPGGVRGGSPAVAASDHCCYVAPSSRGLVPLTLGAT